WKMDSSEKDITVSTSLLKVTVEKETGAVTFREASGKQLFRDAKRIMTPEVVNGEKTYRGETVVEMYGTQEGFYGLGQHQAGVWRIGSGGTGKVSMFSIRTIQTLKQWLSNCTRTIFT